jgi:hypothetical protein
MIVAAHQPNLIPWLGYFDKMQRADVFISVDHVQVERQSFQTRTRILTGEGARWITVPVVQESRDERIMDKKIDNSRVGRFRWGRKMALTLKYAYQSTPHYRMYEPALAQILDMRWEMLADLNLALIEFCRDALGIRTPVVKSSELKISGAKSEMVLNMCKELGADAYLSGAGASRDYLDVAAFERAGIQVLWQEFQHPEYAQGAPGEPFVDKLSALDFMFRCGGGAPAGRPSFAAQAQATSPSAAAHSGVAA